MEASGRMGGQVWTEGGDPVRKESGAEASTSESNDDQFGDAQEHYWQEKTDEETDRFLKRQGLQPPDAAEVGKGGLLYPQTPASVTSWQVLGGLCIAAAVGVTGYSLWEAERYRIAVKDQQTRESTATVGIATPMPLAPQNWAPWQILPLSLALLISLFCPPPQTIQFTPPRGPLPGGSDSSGLALRVHRLEEEFDSGIKTVRFLARQLEKLGVRFRLSRRTLRDPIRENTDSIEAAKAELAMVNARLLRLEEGLFEAQEIMLAMQAQQAKQFAVLAAALPKVASAQRRFMGANKQKTNDLGPKPSVPGGRGSPVEKSGSVETPAKAVQAKAGQILGSIRVPFVGEHDGEASVKRKGGAAKRPRNSSPGASTTRGEAFRERGASTEKGPARHEGTSLNAVQSGVRPAPTKVGSSPDPWSAEASAPGNGVPTSERTAHGPSSAGEKVDAAVDSKDPLKMLSALDAESLVKNVEVPERFVEEKAMWEAYKNSLVDRKVDLHGPAQ
ncbi:hypothetical protein KFL_001730340 [Klebsormidium nitens]|uniref:Uncharacterized protein n=1 Tax=Klebsormidium nitens TaxID=105231 RepID=A0A1Y1I4E7_KLENI|nr:hypothetical protein KFL_001730340 [Klebsormidium nitens]|eukprot:GAQ84041.1 hypothetical protein KFL_001730340 [Klebsormidium nitens]